MRIAPLRKPLILLAVVVCIFYLYYRTTFTLNLTTPYATFASVFLLAGEAFGIVVLLLYFLQIWDPREPEPQPPLPGKTVDVFVPTYNEDPLLLRATLEACVRMDYPHRTYVLDDGRRPEVEALARELGVVYITRPENKHAKAGNLNNAFSKTDGEFIVVFDADHVPEPNFITKLIGEFRDEKVGFVQTPHAFYNFDSFQALLNHEQRKYWEEGHLFYCVIQPGRNRWKCPIFAGSAAMFRRKALEDAGFIATETITEDMHTGLRMHAKGWTSLATSERLVAGQAAPDITTFHNQRLRWGEGNLSIMAYDNPLFMRGLSLAQRLCYFGSMIHWSSGLFKVAIYLTPILMLFTGVPPVNEFNWPLAVVTATYLFLTLFTIKYASMGYGSIVNAELFSMVNFWTQIRATFRALFWRRFQRFVVTSKRGRQSRSVWPYIMPHVLLICVSLLALFWGWSRLAFQISDDYLKPVIPTCWVLFHMLLANMVIRRALWPSDRRFTTRHVVHVPVSYDVEGQAAAMPRFGVSVDLNDGGIGLVAYETLPANGKLRLTIRAASEVVECEAVIRTVTKLSRGAVQGFRYGCKFENLAPEQIDAINRICLHYAVPRLYQQYAVGNRAPAFGSLFHPRSWRLLSRRAAARFPYRLPILLNSGTTPEGVAYAVTEDISRNACTALLDKPVPPGSEVEFLMPTPLNYVLGRAKVLRATDQRYAAKDYHRVVLEFQHFEEQGRTTINTLVNPRENSSFTPVLTPDKKPMPVSVAKPVIYGSLVAVPLILMELGVFQFIYKDELFLRNVVAGRVPIDKQTNERIDSIYHETIDSKWPSTDRLVLLMSVFNKEKKRTEADEVAKLLAPRDRNNFDLALANLDASINARQYAEAEEKYQRLLRVQQRGLLPSYQTKELYVAGARSAVHSGDLALALERFNAALEAAPDDMAIRNEYAGILIRSRHYKEAEALYAEVAPDVEARRMLVYAYANSNRYEDAENQARLILANNPDDLQGQLLLATVLEKRKQSAAAADILKKLLDQNPRDPDVRLKMAQISLEGNHYNEALELFQPLVDEGVLNDEVVQGYVDAANGADSLGEPQRRSAVKIFDRNGGVSDPIFLARLAWFLERVGEKDKSAILLDRALTLNPKDPTVRIQLAGAMMAADRWAEALKLAENDNSLEAHFLMISIRLHNKEYEAAEKEARWVMERQPKDRNYETQKLLAVALVLNRKYTEALPLLEELRVRNPKDADIPVRIAETYLANKDFTEALARLEDMLTKNFDQPKLWPLYIDAASGTPTLTEPQGQLAIRIFDRFDVARSKEPLSLSRLAWVMSRLDKNEPADKLLDRAVALNPKQPDVRKELAGVLAAVGRYPEAVKMYEGIKNLDTEDRLKLAGVYAALKDYPAAEKILKEVEKESPNDPRVLRVKADVLAGVEKYNEAIALYDKLITELPKDLSLKVKLAEVKLASRDYQGALDRFQSLLSASFDQPKLWTDFVNAASSAESLTEANKQTAAQIYDRVIDQPERKVEFLSRLAWVLFKANQLDRCNKLLDKAVALKPTAPETRRELAGALAAAGRNEAALAMYEGLELTVADRLSKAAIYVNKQDLAAAEKEARALYKEYPANPGVIGMLADVLSWNKDEDQAKYAEAKSLYMKLREIRPNDTDVAVKLAFVALWSRDYDGALERFQELLDKLGPNLASLKPEKRDEIWKGFLDAAASAKVLKPKTRETLTAFGDKLAEKNWSDAIYLTRMAYVWGRLDDRTRSIDLFKRALALQPKSTTIRLQYAQTLYAFGDFSAADTQYNELRRVAPNLFKESRVPMNR
jgi:cellulose synthase/poly-beta-1,6-N-acetylglucosamine synthase-like glycosyltransferase/tetratricopeptide (TPR) repeat protein